MHDPLHALALLCAGLLLPAACTDGSEPAAPTADQDAAEWPMPPLDVTAYGAIPDDDQDDSPGIQRAVDVAKRLVSQKTVVFPPGTYVIEEPIRLAPGLTLLGEGATLTRPPDKGEFHRLLTTEAKGYVHSGDTDSAPLVIRGFRFDGNSANQGGFRDFEKEHQSSIFLRADPTRPGRLVALVEDVEFVNGAGDGISVYTNVDLTARRIRARDVFRGAITVTGGNSVVRMEDVEAGGDEFPTGVTVEVNGEGYGETDAAWITASGLRLRGRLLVELRDDGRFTGTDIVSGPPLAFSAIDQSVIEIQQATFEVADAPLRVQFAHDVRFTDVTIRQTAPSAAADPGQALRALRVVWNTDYQQALRDQKLECVRCRFVLTDGVSWGAGTVAVQTDVDLLERNNRLILRDSHVGPGFTIALDMNFGGRWEVHGTDVRADTAAILRYRDTPQFPGYFYDVLFERLPGVTAPIIERGQANPGNRLTIRP